MLGHAGVHKIRREDYRPRKKVVFMFYDSSNDIKWLRSLNIDFQHEFPGSEVLDIQKVDVPNAIARGLEYATSNRHAQVVASKLYRALGFAIENAHNGGNDAMYGLRAYLAGMVLTTTQYGQLSSGNGALTSALDRFGRVVTSDNGN
jgi:hypothetical protein